MAMRRAPTVEDFCHVSWSSDYEQLEVSVSIERSGFSLSTASPVPNVTLPIYRDGELLLELALTHVEIQSLVVSTNRCFIGVPLDDSQGWEFAASWIPQGTLRGWLAFEDAKNIVIGGLGIDLCALLCGESCDELEANQCPNPADVIPQSDEKWGFLLQADVGAGAVTVD